MDNDFSKWVSDHLSKRKWGQADLLRSAEVLGYKMNSAQLSRILNREKAAGIEYVIAIAHGLGLSREEAFRARGWLLKSKEEDKIVLSSGVVEVVLEIERLPVERRNLALKTIRALLEVFSEEKE